MAKSSTEANAVYSSFSGYIQVSDPDQLAEGGTKRLPISGITTLFPLNEFPTATIAIPVGRAATTPDETATLKAKAITEELKHFKKIECFVKITGEFAPGKEWPDKFIRVFNGYVTGTSLSRSTQALTVVVHATHWLMDMDASSPLSDDLVVGAPVAIKLPARSFNLGSSSADAEDDNLKKMPEDLWLTGLKPAFVGLATKGTLMTRVSCAPDEFKSGQTKLVNDIALRRIQGAGETEGVFDLADKVDVPSLTFEEDMTNVMRGHISLVASGLLYNGSLGTSSFWDKLMEFANMFQFVVVPTIDSAVCAPLMPAMAGDDPPRHVTIKAREYFKFSPSQAVYRTWRGVLVIGHYMQNFDSAAPGGEQRLNTDPLQDVGCYLAEADTDLPADYRNRVKLGTVRYVQAPPYLYDKTMLAVMTLRRTLPITNPDVNHGMADPGDTASEVDEPKHEPDGSSDDKFDLDQLSRLGDLYAKWYYWTKHFMSRTGEIVGKLRFDISPGSVVRIEDLDGKLYEDPADFSYMYAHVTSVRTVIDVSNTKAMTAFTLSHIRRDSEKKYGTSKHPMYKAGDSGKKRWVGTVLQNIAMKDSGSGLNAQDTTFVPEVGKHEVT